MIINLNKNQKKKKIVTKNKTNIQLLNVVSFFLFILFSGLLVFVFVYLFFCACYNHLAICYIIYYFLRKDLKRGGKSKQKIKKLPVN